MNSQWSASDREKEYFNLRRTKEQTKKKLNFNFLWCEKWIFKERSRIQRSKNSNNTKNQQRPINRSMIDKHSVGDFVVVVVSMFPHSFCYATISYVFFFFFFLLLFYCPWFCSALILFSVFFFFVRCMYLYFVMA